MLVVTAFRYSFGIDFLSQGRAEESPFHIMDSQGIPGKHPMDVTAVNKCGKRIPRIPIKNRRRAEDPENKTVLPFMIKEIIELVIVNGKGCFTGDSRPEGEFFREVVGKIEGAGMYENAVFPVFPPPDCDHVTFFEMPELFNGKVSVFFQDHNAIHPGFPKKMPSFFADLKVFRIY
jgi:hypothetical protein